MDTEITVPSVGESITTGILAVWLKADGDTVAEGDDLFELETEKTTIAFPSPAGGVLETLVDAGTEVNIGQQVAALHAAATPAAKPASTSLPDQEQKGRSETKGTGVDESAGDDPDVASVEDASSALSPAVRRMVNEAGLNPDTIAGTGRNGRITTEDVRKAAAERTVGKTRTTPSVPNAEKVERASDGRPRRRVPMTAIRRKTAARLVEAKQTTAYLTTFNEIDMKKVMEIRAQYKVRFEQQHGIKVGFMSFFVKAACQALKQFPEVNSLIDGEDLVYQDFCDIGIAMSIDSGLIVPVVRDADRKSFADIETAIASLAERGRKKKLLPEDLSGGTFTITNGGVFGSMLSTPIPAYPQTAILGMHAIRERPVVVDGEVVIRPIMYAALTYDHRVIDGREAVGFLMRVKEFIEQPDTLLLEM